MARSTGGYLLEHLSRLVGARAADDPSERQLLEAFTQRHDQDAFAVLLERYGPMVLAVCRRILENDHDAEDAFQATFLILARKATAPDRRRPLANWLHKVAYHVALRSKMRLAQRRVRERLVVDMPAAELPDHCAWREVRQVLDEEVNRLPEKYRTPVVLCYLQGQTNEEAARQIGCPHGTVLSRLSRARERLRGRLTGRGIALSAGTLATLLATEAGPRAFAATFTRSTTQLAIHFVAGEAAGTVPAPVLALTNEVLNTMLTRKLVWVLAILLLGGLGAGGALFAVARPAAALPQELALAADPLVPQGLAPAPRLASGQPLWTVSTIKASEERGEPSRDAVEDLISKGVKQLEQKGFPALPAFHPIGIPGHLIYRSYHEVDAACLKDIEFAVIVGGKKIIEKRKPGDHAWWTTPTEGGVSSIFRDASKKEAWEGWRDNYAREMGNAYSIFENSICGTLSTDGTLVYAIDDLVLQPHPQVMATVRSIPLNRQYLATLNDQVIERNTLNAYSIQYGGKISWVLGDKYDTNDHATQGTKGSFFLGPPLALDRKLYVLNEKDGVIRLICLQPKDSMEKNPKPPDILWVQVLVTAKNNFNLDFNRRMHAAQVVHGEGVLICPTNAGTVAGVDLQTHGVLWKYQYREPEVEPKKPAVQPVAYLINEWKVTAPVIIDGKVVFTAPDSQSIHCLGLREGRPVWKEHRAADDLYFGGVFDGKVIIVGKSYIRALDLTTGKELWKLANTGIPSGQGAVCDHVYYLPVRPDVRKAVSVADAKRVELLIADLQGANFQARDQATQELEKLGEQTITTLRKVLDNAPNLEVTKRVESLLQRLMNQGRLVAISIPKGQVVGTTKLTVIPGNLVFHDGYLLSQGLDSVTCFPFQPKP